MHLFLHTFFFSGTDNNLRCLFTFFSFSILPVLAFLLVFGYAYMQTYMNENMRYFLYVTIPCEIMFIEHVYVTQTMLRSNEIIKELLYSYAP